MLNIDKCDFCGSEDLSSSYMPIGTEYEVSVKQCNKCYLIQSYKNKNEGDFKATTSTDADWGNVRHGKGLRLDIVKKKINLIAIANKAENILDIGSNRGDFIKFLIENNINKSKINAVEPDKSIIDYSDLITVNNKKLEEIDFGNKKFDFIYSCHTLEHALSAKQMIKSMSSLLNDGGVIVLDVPNAEIIRNKKQMEEFFIDKHSFHFTPNQLEVMLKTFKLNVTKSWVDEYNIIYKCVKSESEKLNISSSKELDFSNEIIAYKNIILKNREALKLVVSEKINPLFKRQKVAVFGAGRPLDTLIKYGNLNPKEFSCIVDNYLAGKHLVCGINIEKPHYLKINEPNVVLIAANSAEKQLAEVAYRMGIRHVVLLSELLDQYE